MHDPFSNERDPDDLEASLLNSLVALDESLRNGHSSDSALEVLDLSLSQDLTAGTLCLLELEAVFPRHRHALNRSEQNEFPSRVGKFKIEGILGSGGFGIVYKGLDPQLKRTVAVKVPRSHAFATPDHKKRFIREAYAAAKLDHPNIVPIYEAGEAESVPYIAYAYCDGPTLARWCMSQDELMPPRSAAKLMLPLAEATAYSHSRGILHRDIKPTNVLLFPKSKPGGIGIPFEPKLSDLGLAKVIEPNAEDMGNSTLLGTPSYMSPEQSQGGVVAETSDVYSLGATLYFLLTGRPPFASTKLVDLLTQLAEREPIEPRLLNSGVDAELNTICMKCLEKRPIRRYPTAQELVDDLTRFLNGIPIQARPVSTLFRLKRWSERKPAIASMFVGICILTIGLLSSLGYNAITFSQLNTQLVARNVELASTIGRLDNSLQSAKEQTLRAESNELRAKQVLYTVDIQRALEALKRNDFRSAASILNREGSDHALRDFCWQYLNARVTGEVEQLACVEKQIWNLALAVDGKTLAAGDAGGCVHLFDVSVGCSPIRSWDTGQLEVNSVAFSPDSSLLATAGDDGRVGIWNVATAEHIRWFDATETKPVYGVEFFDNGEKVVACGKSPILFIWNVKDGELIHSIATRHFKGIEALSVSPDGLRVATAGHDEFTRIYPIGQSSPLIEIESQNDRFTTVRFSRDGKSLLTGSRRRWLRLWDSDTGHLQNEFELTDHICSVAFSPAGQVVACESGGTIRMFDLGSTVDHWQPVRTWADNSRRLNGLVCAQDGLSFFTGDSAGQLQRWQLKHLAEFDQLVQQESSELVTQFNGICIDDQSQLCYRAGRMGLECWDIKTSKRIAWIINDRVLRSCKLRPDRQSIVIGDAKGNVAIIPNSDKGRPHESMRPNWLHVLNATAVARLELSNDGRRLFVLGDDSELAIVELESGQVVKRLSNRSAMALSPDGKWLVTGRHGTDDLEIADADTYDVIAQLGPKQSTIYRIEFNRDGSKLLTTSGDRSARLWDTKSWTLIHTLHGHSESVFASAISPDGRTIATGDKAGSICLWNSDVGQKLMEFSLPKSEVASLCFTEDGRSLIASTALNEVFVFKAE